MKLWDTLKSLSFRLFGKSLEPYAEYFGSIKSDIEMSGLRLSLVEYVYIMFFVSFLIFITEFPLLSFMLGFFTAVPMAFFLSLTLALFMSMLTFFIFYSYPALISGARKKNIDGALPFATTYLATIAGSRAPPITMFRVLSQFREYGEVAKEAKKIYTDVSVFGMDLQEAMRKTAGRTPSAQLKELLWGMTNVIQTGGEMSLFLREKSKGFMQEYRRSLEQFSQRISLLIEVYLTLIIVGSIFFVILSAIMSIFSSGIGLLLSFLQFLIIFLVMPVVSVVFIIIIKSVSPSM